MKPLVPVTPGARVALGVSFFVLFVAVVGPQPGAAEPKAVYAGVQGAQIRLTQDSYFEIRGQVAEGEDFAGRVKAIATSFAFGDLTTLRQGGGY